MRTLGERGRALRDALLIRLGDPAWGAFARVTAVLAFVGVAVVALWPEHTVLWGYAVATVAFTGPLSPVVPGAFEAATLTAGAVEPPLLVAAVGIVVNLWVEFLKYRLVAGAWRLDWATRVRQRALVARVEAAFRRAPFFTVWFCSWSPAPYWLATVLASLAGYPVSRYLAATFLGRFPRLFVIAAFGAWLPSGPGLLVATVAACIVLGVVFVWATRSRAPTEETRGTA